MAKDTQTIVDDHRNMLMVSKKISTFQEENLKSWAFLFFPGLSELKVDWNFLKKRTNDDGEEEEIFHPGRVSFNLKFPKGFKIPDEQAQEGIDRLVACTKFLFWNDTSVNVKKSGKIWKIETNNLPNQSSTTLQKKS